MAPTCPNGASNRSPLRTGAGARDRRAERQKPFIDINRHRKQSLTLPCSEFGLNSEVRRLTPVEQNGFSRTANANTDADGKRAEGPEHRSRSGPARGSGFTDTRLREFLSPSPTSLADHGR